MRIGGTPRRRGLRGSFVPRAVWPRWRAGGLKRTGESCGSRLHGAACEANISAMRSNPVSAALLLAAPAPALSAQHFPHLAATPKTVAYGYYSAAATPVLRIASGDTIEVETLITNRPDRLEAAGVAPADVQQSLRDIVSQVTDRGPGGHILTGPIFVEGADSGDVLEVRILRIDLSLRYGYNGCSGFLPANCDTTQRTRIIPLDRRRMVAQFAPGVVIPLHPFFGSM